MEGTPSLGDALAHVKWNRIANSVRAFLYTHPPGFYDQSGSEAVSRRLNLTGPIQFFILWSHAMAAVAWVGGSLFFAVALNPSIQRLGKTPERVALVAATSREFREVVRLSILIFLVTGGILVFTRLGWARIPNSYVAVLAVKVVLSLIMFWLTGRIGAGVVEGEGRVRRAVWWIRPQYLILELGVIVYALSIVLRLIYDDALTVIP